MATLRLYLLLTLMHIHACPQLFSVTVSELLPQPTQAGADVSTSYIAYTGPASSFPDRSSWTSFDTMWTLYAPGMRQFPASEAVMPLIRSNLIRVSLESGVDPRLLLAVVMQESSGNVDPITTYGANRNTGMMQAANGSVYSTIDPSRSIYLMIRDGAMGPGHSDVCLANYINRYRNYWDALAVYNQGEFGANFEDLDQPTCCTQHYVQMVANRLHGWTEPWILNSVGVETSTHGDTPTQVPVANPSQQQSWQTQQPHTTRAVNTLEASDTSPNVYWAVTNSAFMTDVYWYSNATH